jgi:hypothetical protein
MEKPPDLLFTYDPGRTFGWALFREGILVDSGHCSEKAWLAGKLSAQALRAGMKLPPTPEAVRGAIFVGELPRYYHQGNGEHKATPADLIALALTLGEFRGAYRRHVSSIRLLTAHEWKGSVRKDISHRRIKKTLVAGEVFPKNHNARDAVGMGLSFLGRYR